MATAVEMLSGRRKNDYAADALAARATALGVEPALAAAGAADGDEPEKGVAPGNPKPVEAVLVA